MMYVGRCAPVPAWMWKSEDNFVKLALLLFSQGSGTDLELSDMHSECLTL